MDLRTIKTEWLELYIAMSALFLWALFAFHVPFLVLEGMKHEMAAWKWETAALFLFSVSALGYLEDMIFLRRAGSALSSVFWLISGLSLMSFAPYAGLLHIGHGVLFNLVWTQVGVDEIKRQVRSDLPLPILSENAEVPIQIPTKA